MPVLPRKAAAAAAYQAPSRQGLECAFDRGRQASCLQRIDELSDLDDDDDKEPMQTVTIRLSGVLGLSCSFLVASSSSITLVRIID
jgi:hypothetical protein